MARVYQQKSRKIRTCQKCGRQILPGDVYFSAQPWGMREMIRCVSCRPERSEMTSSDYFRWLWNLQDHLSDIYDLTEDGVVDEIISELESQRDELDDKLSNMPEQLQDSDSGQTLQDRISSLEDAIGELENVEYPDEDDEEYQAEDDEPLCYEIEESAECLLKGLYFSDLKGENYEYVTEDLKESYGFVRIITEEYDHNEGGEVTYASKDDKSVKIKVTFEKRYQKDEEAYERAIEEYSEEIENIISNIE